MLARRIAPVRRGDAMCEGGVEGGATLHDKPAPPPSLTECARRWEEGEPAVDAVRNTPWSPPSPPNDGPPALIVPVECRCDALRWADILLFSLEALTARPHTQTMADSLRTFIAAV